MTILASRFVAYLLNEQRDSDLLVCVVVRDILSGSTCTVIMHVFECVRENTYAYAYIKARFIGQKILKCALNKVNLEVFM